MNKFLLLLFLYVTPFFAQDKVEIDSLKQIVQEEILHDSIISSSYATLLRHFKRNNEDSCLAYFDRLKAYADKTESNLAYYHYYRLKAGYYGLFPELSKDKYAFMTSNLHQALKYSEKTGDPKLVVYTYSRLGQEVVRLGKNEEALGYVQQAIKIAIEENLWYEMAYIYGQTGELYSLGFNMTETALPFLLKSDSIYVANNFQGDKRGSTLSYIGDVYTTFGNIEEARSYQEEALAIFRGSNNEFKQKLVLGKMANIESLDKNYSKAINYMLECIAYYRDKKFPINEGIYQTLLSDIYYDSNQIEKAIEAGQTAIELNERSNYDYGLFLALVNQSNILHENGDYSKSNELALEAENLGLALNNFSNLKPVYEKLYLNSEKLGDFEKAYKYSKEYKRVSDTLVARQNIQDAKELEAQYKNAQQKQEIQLLQSQNELVEEQKRSQRNLLFAIIGAVFLAGVVLFVLYRNRRKTATKLRELDTAKTTFFENISHEFRTPLSLIKGPLEKRLSSKDISATDRKEFEMIQRNSDRLMELIDQLLDISKLESSYYNLKVSEGNLSALLRSIASSFDHLAREEKLNYTISIPHIEQAWFDSDAIEKIVVNLLSNAFKFSPDGSSVSFETVWEDNNIEIRVENDGVCLTDSELNSIFERFSRLEKDGAEAKQGSGIGLSLVKELVSLSHGTILAESTSSSSVRFTVSLPIHKEAFGQNEIRQEDLSNETTLMQEADVVFDSEGETEIPLLLIVDDNADIREFIRQVFKDHYQIIEANDGEVGETLATEHIPDIIISDVMMPKVTGIELCEKLKQDERTSHIPIILLTAKADEKSKFKGFELGADDYIPKPFSIKILKSRVKNLVTSRAKLRNRYSKEVILRPKDISINSFDEQFIEKLKVVLDDKITDDSFRVEELSQLLTMSRMQLHRKMKALTGLSASEFLRTERLKLAKTLLDNKDVHINEVCYKVGFNNPSYFAKCFKDTYGATPSQYRASL